MYRQAADLRQERPNAGRLERGRLRRTPEVGGWEPEPSRGGKGHSNAEPTQWLPGYLPGTPPPACLPNSPKCARGSSPN